MSVLFLLFGDWFSFFFFILRNRVFEKVGFFSCWIGNWLRGFALHGNTFDCPWYIGIHSSCRNRCWWRPSLFYFPIDFEGPGKPLLEFIRFILYFFLYRCTCWRALSQFKLWRTSLQVSVHWSSSFQICCFSRCTFFVSNYAGDVHLTSG